MLAVAYDVCKVFFIPSTTSHVPLHPLRHHYHRHRVRRRDAGLQTRAVGEENLSACE